MESAYLHLLKPLRALADNWDIDLAAELSEYVDVVNERQQSQAQSQPHAVGTATEFGVNFAQAALLIQNSANIYSKKVQYLYNLTNETHDYILHRKPSSHADRTGHDDSHAGVTGGDEDDDDATAFACLDDCLVQRDCRLAANDALVQVVNLPALSVSNHHGGMLPAQQEELLTVRGESVGYRHEFEINDAYICDDGSFHFNILLPSFGGDNVLSASPPPSTIDGDVELVLGEAAQGYGADDAPASFGEVALEPVNGDDVHDGDEQVPWNDHNDEDEAAPPPDDYVNNAETGDQATAHDDDDDVDFGASFVPLELDADINAPRVLRPATTHTDDNVAQPRVPKATKPEVDFWEALDPHVVPATGATVRPFRKGAVSKTYRVVEQSVKRSAAGKALDTTVREFLLKMDSMEKHRAALPKDPLHRLTYPEFDYIYFEEKKRRLDVLHARQKGAVSSLALMMEEGTTGAFRPEDNVFDLPSAEALPGQEIYDMDGGADDVDETIAAPQSTMAMESSQFTLGNQDPEYIQSFETLCQLRIQNYLEKATHFEKAVESVLAKRVRKWENRLHPLLEEQNNRQQYDIEVYRDKVLDSFKQKLAVAKRQEDPIAFESVARGIEKFDVCRYFLASLHLANEGRVVIVKDNEERMLLKPVM